MSKRRKGPYVRANSSKPPKDAPLPSGSVVSEEFIDSVSQDPRVKLVQADFEKQAALEQTGLDDQVYGFWGVVHRFLVWYDKKAHGFRFKKKTYLWLLFLTGWMGGHRWYQGRRILGLIETLLFWTGIPFILCVSDFMEIFPLQADESGYVVL